MTVNNIRAEVQNLLAYFPGRQRLAFLWLIFLPGVSIAFAQHFYGGISRAPSNGGVPFYLFNMAGSSFDWVYTLALAVALLRICHSPRDSWARSAGIMASSTIYSLIAALPAFLVAFVWAAVCLGTSLSAIVEVSAGLVLCIGALLILVVLLGALAHRFGLVIPLLLYLITAYHRYLLPIAYPAEMVAAHWRALLTFGVPLSPTITILRHGMLHQGIAPATYWTAAIIHALVGYGLAFWVWKTIPNNSPETIVACRGEGLA